MAISKTPQQAPFPLRATEELTPSVDRFSPIPTPEDVKVRYLFGIPLKSSITGETLPDEAIQFYINSAISEIEHMLDIYITPVKFYEQHDYIRENFTWNYNFLKLNHAPILYVSKVELSFSNNIDERGFVNFPLEHVHVQSQEGIIQLVPAFGTSLSGFLLSAFGGVQYHAMRAMGMNNFPGGVRVEYTSGLEPGKVPAVISQLIGITGAIHVLSGLGPILFPNNSESLGIDGVSQSSGGAGVRHFADRIDYLTKERDRQLQIVKGYYAKAFLIDYF
jgi:hypothetical protein